MIGGGTILVPSVSARYATRAGSNVGKVVVSAMGRQRSRTINQRLSIDENFDAAVRALVLVLLEGLPTSAKASEVQVELLDSNDSGTVRSYRVSRVTR